MAYQRDAEKQREYQRQWVADRRAAWIEKNGPCAECGSTENLEVDHVNPNEKERESGTLWSLSPRNPVRVAELAKCQVLCGPCHQQKTTAEQVRSIPHGTKQGYKRGCRCEPCHQALLDWWRVKRAREKQGQQ